MYTRDIKGWQKHLDFILVDEISLFLSFLLGLYIRHKNIVSVFSEQSRIIIFVAIAINFIVLVTYGTLSGVLRRGYYKEFTLTFKSACISALGLFAYLFITKSGATYSRIAIFNTYLLYIFITYLSRLLLKRYIKHSNKYTVKPSTLVVGNKKLVTEIIDDVNNDIFVSKDITGIILNGKSNVSEIKGIKVVGNYQTIVEYATHNWVDEIIVPMDTSLQLDDETLKELVSMGVTVHMLLPKMIKDIGAKEVVSSIGTTPVLSATLNYLTPKEALYKRTMDIIGGLVGSLLTLIIFIFVAPIIYIKSPGPIFFAQTRIGKNGKKFKMYKFRSMYPDAETRLNEVMKQNRVKDGYMFKMKYDPRIIGNYIDENGKQHTGIGEFIRKTSLDEFPQFFNVLKGDMSLVGTRPPLENEYAKYSAFHKARLSMKPGITGLWQVSGRSNITDFDEVVRLDTTYINEWSIGLDIKILFKTIAVVFKKEGSM